MMRVRELWNERIARRACKRREKRQQQVWDDINFASWLEDQRVARIRAAVEREMQRQQLSQWDVPEEAARILDMLAEPGEFDDPA